MSSIIETTSLNRSLKVRDDKYESQAESCFSQLLAGEAKEEKICSGSRALMLVLYRRLWGSMGAPSRTKGIGDAWVKQPRAGEGNGMQDRAKEVLERQAREFALQPA